MTDESNDGDYREQVEHSSKEEAAFSDRVQLLGNYVELLSDDANAHLDEEQAAGQDGSISTYEAMENVRLTKIQAILGVLTIVLLAIIVFYFTTGQDLLAGLTDTATESAGDIATSDPAEGETAPSIAELETQQPVLLTDGPWRFFADDSQSRAVYDIQFEADGACIVPGDPHVYGGVYVEDGPAVEITLFHRELLEAGSFSKLHENEEWFHMTRVGNTMYGTWEVEDSYYSEEGLVVEGTRINLPNVFAHPERPGGGS